MRLSLPRRWHGITTELAKFGTIGVVNLFVNFAVFNVLALTVLADGQLKAKASATVVATTCAYFMNRHRTYRDRPKSALRREYSLFFFFNLVGLVIEVAVVGLAKYGLGITHLIALNLFTALGILLGTTFRFWSYRTHVFRPAFVTATTAHTTAVPVPALPALTTAASVPSVDPLPASLADQLALAGADGGSLAEEIDLDSIVALADEPAPTTG